MELSDNAKEDEEEVKKSGFPDGVNEKFLIYKISHLLLKIIYKPLFINI